MYEHSASLQSCGYPAQSRGADSVSGPSAPPVLDLLRLDDFSLAQAGLVRSAQPRDGQVGTPEAHEKVVSRRYELRGENDTSEDVPPGS